MEGPKTTPNTTELMVEAQERSVLVDGKYLGRELNEFKLRSLSGASGGAYLGADAFTQVFLETDSGNIYLIYKPKTDDPIEAEWLSGNWVIANGRSSHDGQLIGSEMSDLTVENAEVKVGEPFSYIDGTTTPITKITAVITDRVKMGGLKYDAEPSDIVNKWRALTGSSTR